jgi:predicted dehydrogenase
MSFCVVGGGKMGLSHLALITPYLGKSNVFLVERKRSVRFIFRLMGYKVFASLDALVKTTGMPKGLLIATPTSAHAEVSEWAIARRVPFFVEKPLTLDPERSAALVKMADEANVAAQTGFVMRYVATFQRLRALVSDGQLGHLRSYRASMRGNVITKPPKPKNWQGDFARGGGCLNEYGPHIIDLCRFVFGEVEDVTRAEKGRVLSANADDWVDLDWKHVKGVTGTLHINWCDAAKRKSVIEIEAEFDHASVRVDNSAVEIEFKDAAPLDDSARAQLNRPTQLSNVAFYLRGEEFSLEVEDFLGACLGQSLHVDSNPPTGVTPTLYDGYVVDCLIDDIARKAGLK